MKCHNSKPTRDQLTENTTIITRATDRFRLAIKEALYITKLGPLINKQYDNFTNILKLYNHRNNNVKPDKEVALNTHSNKTALPSLTLSTIEKALNLPPNPPNPFNPPNLTSSFQPPPQNRSRASLSNNTQTFDTVQNSDLYSPSLPLPPMNSLTSLPDMHEILLHFGIEPSNFRVVPLKDYDWSKINTCHSLTYKEPPTISQRIKTLVRGARHNKI